MEELRRIEIAIALDSGEPPEQIAKRFRVPLREVQQVLALSAPYPAEPLEAPKPRKGSARLNDAERAMVVKQVAEGQSLAGLAEAFGVRPSTLKRWCQQEGVVPRRDVSQLKASEVLEVRELLETGEPPDTVAQAYSLTQEAVAELSEPPHRDLPSATLAFLLELLRENPKASATSICQEAQNFGMDVGPEAVESYRRKLLRLGRLG